MNDLTKTDGLPPSPPARGALDGEVIPSDPRALKINAKYREALDSLGKAIKAAIDGGEELRKVKASLPHGQFSPWLRDNTNMMPRTAQDWMRLAAHRKQIETAMRDDGLNSIVAALRMIRQSPDPKPEPTISEDVVVLEIVKKIQVVLGKDHKRGLIVAQRVAERIADMRLVD